jgi:hypothetical protein
MLTKLLDKPDARKRQNPMTSSAGVIRKLQAGRIGILKTSRMDARFSR